MGGASSGKTVFRKTVPRLASRIYGLLKTLSKVDPMLFDVRMTTYNRLGHSPIKVGGMVTRQRKNRDFFLLMGRKRNRILMYDEN